MTASEPIIRFDGVSAGWIEDCPVVQDLTLAFDSPGVTALTGRNGTGKSTVVELISGYLRPWTGAVEVNGFSAQSAAARAKRRVCRTAPALFSLMTVRDHLVLSARSAGCDVDAQLGRAEALGLGPWLKEHAGTLSSGSAKKAWYVFCTAGLFDVVVLDEPFNALDAAATEVVMEEILSWGKDRCVVVIAHQPPAGLVPDRTVDLTPWAACNV